MRKKLNLSKDTPRLTPCAARFVELLIARVPYLEMESNIALHFAESQRSELDLQATSPSGHLLLEIESSPEGIELRFSEKGKSGAATAVFYMHPLNFHRTSEAAADFVEKIAEGKIIVAREKKRVFPFFGHKRVRFFELGEIVGERASEIEKVYSWDSLHI